MVGKPPTSTPTCWPPSRRLHNRRVNGREPGQWHEADLEVAHWLQHTSRDGEMQLHVHSQIAHIARTATDGKWRAPDSLGTPHQADAGSNPRELAINRP